MTIYIYERCCRKKIWKENVIKISSNLRWNMNGNCKKWKWGNNNARVFEYECAAAFTAFQYKFLLKREKISKRRRKNCSTENINSRLNCRQCRFRFRFWCQYNMLSFGRWNLKTWLCFEHCFVGLSAFVLYLREFMKN